MAESTRIFKRRLSQLLPMNSSSPHLPQQQCQFVWHPKRDRLLPAFDFLGFPSIPSIFDLSAPLFRLRCCILLYYLRN
ncbi:hypothetical protein RB195_010800 [Necator americanus]|uniref:Uncharacterized protein n=1 Tax=Necator americanus TaxID=51031 RepID=A0ABR1CZU2_NECAM